MHEALAPEGHEVWLLLAPIRQDLGPLRGPTQIEGVDARRDDPAVDDPRRNRRDLAGRHRDHRVIEHPHAGGCVTERDGRLALAKQAEGEEVVVVASAADVDDAVG